MTDEHEVTLRTYGAELATSALTDYAFILFVSGASEISARAISNARSLCDLHLAGRYRLQVVDIHREVDLMMVHEVLAAPTLIRMAPQPIRRLVGDLSDVERALAALDILQTLPATSGTAA